MADFWQQGTITVLQRLKNRPIEDLEREIEAIARRRRIVLLLPALYSEFETASMPRIVEELKKVKYLHQIVISLDRADQEQFKQAKKFVSEIPFDVKIVWHDGPGMQALYRELKEANFNLDHPGKGQSVWMTLGYILSERAVYAVATHDCDIVNYHREMLARLVYPVVHPATDFEFSKGYYARVTDKLYGRVTRLFYTPLIRTLRRILGQNLFLSYLDNFRYALSGEFAMIASLASGIRIAPTWGLEISLLSEIYQMASVNRICQVEIAENYEHRICRRPGGHSDAACVGADYRRYSGFSGTTQCMRGGGQSAAEPDFYLRPKNERRGNESSNRVLLHVWSHPSYG
jgi:glucosyl-3-phosphoglycerate synthase